MNEHDRQAVANAWEEAVALRAEKEYLRHELVRLSELYIAGKSEWEANRPPTVYLAPSPPRVTVKRYTPREVADLKYDLARALEQVAVLTSRVVTRDGEIKRLRQALAVTRAQGRDEEDDALFYLTERERFIISERDKGITLKALGILDGVGPERIRQIEAKARRKMAHPSRAKRT